MGRLLALLFVALVFLESAGGAASQQQPATLDISEWGDGWRQEVALPVGGPLEMWESRNTLFGPDGARVMILVYDIGTTITERGNEWKFLLDLLSVYAGVHAFGAESDPTFGTRSTATLPEHVDDAVRNEYIDDYGAPFGYGLYAPSNTSLGVMVIVEGTVNGLTGVAAADYVAGLYFAALSESA